MEKLSALWNDRDHRAVEVGASQRRRVNETQLLDNISNHILRETSGQSGHRYGNTTVGGHGQAHFGDTINQYYNAAQPQVDTYKTLLRSLELERMGARVQLLYACPGSRPMFERGFRSKVNNNQVEDWTGQRIIELPN